MKKCVLFIACILYVNCIYSQNWWNNQFTIGTHSNPPMIEDVDTSQCRDFQTMMNLGINFTVNNHYPNNCRENVYNDEEYSKHIPISIRYLLPKESFSPNKTYPTNCGGFSVKDEPKPEETTYKNKVNSIKSFKPGMLGFVNLFPTYYEEFDSWNKYVNYAQTFAGDTTLQVICFDNYFPQAFFRSQQRSQQNYLSYAYFPNLALLRRFAGNRPLWSYVRCWEKDFVEKDSLWKDAFLSLSAFAPIAFGAKGILYYAYTGASRNIIRRDRGNGWAGNFLHFYNNETNREIFFGHFRENQNGFMDLALKTDSLDGTWRIKCAEDTDYDRRHIWTKTMTWYGASSYTRAFVSDWDLDGLDELGTIRYDGYVFISDSLSGWKYRFSLKDFPVSHFASMKKNMQFFHDFRNDNKPEFCMAWNENNMGRLRVYWDFEPINEKPIPGTSIDSLDALKNYKEVAFTKKIQQILSRNDSLFVLTTDSSVQNYLSICKIYPSDSIYVLPNTLLLCNNTKESHYWFSKENPSRLYGQQDEDGLVAGWNFAHFSDTLYRDTIDTEHSFPLLHVECYDNCATNISPGEEQMFYYTTISEDYDKGIPALVDEHGQTTPIYGIVERINNFINAQLAPVVMNKNYIGTYFVSYPNRDNYTQGDTIINLLNKQDIISELSDSLMVGIFEDELYNYLVIVNMTDSVISNPHITINVVSQQQSSEVETEGTTRDMAVLPVVMQGRSSGLSDLSLVSEQTSSLGRYYWETMLPGECILILSNKLNRSLNNHDLCTGY